MAKTHHCKTKKNAKILARKLRKKGVNVSMNKTKKGYSVVGWR